MKNFNKLLVTGLLLLLFNFAFAQPPQGIAYQAIARNGSGAILANQLVSLRFSIHTGSAGGTVQYSETQAQITNSLGLFNVNIGQGAPIVGTLSAVTWSSGTKFLQVEMDPAGGSSYVNMGTQQMMSVPYALNAGNASGTIASTIYSNGFINTLADNTNYQFFSPSPTVTISAGQKVEVICSATLGSVVAGGATLSKLAVGQKLSSALTPSDNGNDYVAGYKVLQNQRDIVTLNTIFNGLAPGVYQFGMIYQSTSGQAINWNNNDWCRVTVKVINP